MDSTVLAGIISGGISLVTSGVITLLVAERRGSVDKKIAALQGELDEDLANLKARLDQRALFQAERIAHELMSQPDWELRSFAQIKHHIGGWEDEDLRQILIRAGALRFSKTQPGPDSNKNELWGLFERNRHRVAGSNS